MATWITKEVTMATSNYAIFKRKAAMVTYAKKVTMATSVDLVTRHNNLKLVVFKGSNDGYLRQQWLPLLSDYVMHIIV